MDNITDVVVNGQTYGSVAKRLMANGFNIKAFRTLDTLRKDEWKHYDTAVINEVRSRLVGIADLIQMGLVYNIPNGLGKTVLEYEDMSDVQGAHVDMDAATRGQNDRPEFEIRYLPLPITHADFQINARQLAASRTTGTPLDTTIAELKARKVAEKLEEMLFTDVTYAFGGGTIYSYLNHPNKNTVTLGSNWDESAASGATILSDVINMKQALINDGFYGPYMIYIPTNFETSIDDDFKAASDKGIRQRIKEVSGIIDVKVVDKLTSDKVVMVQMTSDVVRLVNGLPVTNVEWSAEGGMIYHFKVMTIQVPQIRKAQSGKCGIVLGSE